MDCTPQQQRENMRSIIERARALNRKDCDGYVRSGNIAKSIEVANRFEVMASGLMERAEKDCGKEVILLGWTP